MTRFLIMVGVLGFTLYFAILFYVKDWIGGFGIAMFTIGANLVYLLDFYERNLRYRKLIVHPIQEEGQ
jgi:hypothetical protein